MVRIARREDIDPTMPSENTVVVAGCNTDALGRMRVPESCKCIADQCAMWRWNGPELKSDKRQGFCGLSPLGWERAT